MPNWSLFSSRLYTFIMFPLIFFIFFGYTEISNATVYNKINDLVEINENFSGRVVAEDGSVFLDIHDRFGSNYIDKYNSNGTLAWQTDIGPLYLYNMKINSEGETFIYFNDNKSIKKLNALGSVEWTVFLGPNVNYVRSVYIFPSDNGGVLAGIEYGSSYSTAMTYMQEYDSLGLPEFAEPGNLVDSSNPTTEWTSAPRIQRLSNGYHLLLWERGTNHEIGKMAIYSSGTTRTITEVYSNQTDGFAELVELNQSDIVLVWTELNYTQLHLKKYGVEGTGSIDVYYNVEPMTYSVASLGDGTFVVAGVYDSDYKTVWAERYDSNRNGLWNGGSGLEVAYADADNITREIWTVDLAVNSSGNRIAIVSDAYNYHTDVEYSSVILLDENGNNLNSDTLPSLTSGYTSAWPEMVKFEGDNLYLANKVSGGSVTLFSALYSIENQISSTDLGVGFIDLLSQNSIKNGSSRGVGSSNNYTTTIRLLNVSGRVITDVPNVDMSVDRDWSAVTYGFDLDAGKSVIDGLIGAPGTPATHNLYIPVPPGGSTAVYICPEASILSEVTDMCPNGVLFEENQTRQVNGVPVTVSKVTVDGNLYWKASGVNGTGGIALNSQNIFTKDVNTRLQVNSGGDPVYSNHRVEFGTVNGLTASGHTIEIQFDPATLAWNLTPIGIGDIDLEDDGVDKVLAAAPGADIWGVTINTGTDTITFTAPTSGTDYISALSSLIVKIGTNADGGVNRIQNPNSIGNYEINIDITNAGTEYAQLEIPIIDDDTVDITGFIDEFLTFDIDVDETTSTDCAYNACTRYAGSSVGSGYTVDLGLLTTSTINNSSTSVLHEDGGTGSINYIMFDLSTNATSGAYVTVDSLNGELNGPGSDSIPSVTDATVVASDGNYGINEVSNSATNGTFTIVPAYNGTVGSSIGTVADGGTPIEIFSTTNAALDTGRVVFEVLATPDSLDGAGTYNDSLSFIATGTF